MLLSEKLRKKRYKKSFKRKKEVARRIKCHGSSQSCKFHLDNKPKIKVKQIKKKTLWQRIKELWKRITKNWLMI